MKMKHIIIPTVGKLNTLCHATICGNHIYIAGIMPTVTGGEFRLVE